MKLRNVKRFAILYTESQKEALETTSQNECMTWLVRHDLTFDEVTSVARRLRAGQLTRQTQLSNGTTLILISK